MYIPTAFQEHDLSALHATMQAARLADLVTHGSEGLIATPLPLLLAPDEGPYGTLYGHVARANPQWQQPVDGDALVLFDGPDAYVTPAWYAAKAIDGKVVPTWNYVAVHAYGRPAFFEDADRLLDVVTRLSARHEQRRPAPWAVSDAPPDYIAAMLRGIVGVRLPITRLQGKRKMSQNRGAVDRANVAAGLAASDDARDRAVAPLIPQG